MTRREMLAFAEGLVVDADEQRRRIAVEQPCREPMARQVLDDVVRAYFLIESCRRSRLGVRRELEVKSRLVRADLLTQALQVPSC